MTGFLSQTLAGLSLFLRQPLESFCDIETSHPGERDDVRLVTTRGDYISVLRIHGVRSVCSRYDIEQISEQLRIDLQGLVETTGHAIEGWYASDPNEALTALNAVSLEGCEAIARGLNANFFDILNERRRRWSEVMRWEDACFILWTRPAVLSREERNQAGMERRESVKNWPKLGRGQRVTVRSDLMAARHDSFVARVSAALRIQGISSDLIPSGEAITMAREALYRETAGSRWKPTLAGDRVMARLPDDPKEQKNAEHALWPSLRDQMFSADAETHGGQLVTVGDYTFAPVDMMTGPEDPRPFSELQSALGHARIPWRSSMILEGGGKGAFTLKETGAQFLSMFSSNRDIQRAFGWLQRKREDENHIAVRMRMTTATWAPVGSERPLRRQAAELSQRLEAWGNTRTTRISGDPLEAAMGSVPVMSLGSTATSSLALLGDALAMMPWMRTASPFKSGSIVFRKPDGGIWPFDPTGGGLREHIADIVVAPPGSGKTVLGNTILLGLLLSSAAMGNQGIKLPLLAKLDIGHASQGFIDMVRNALGPERAHEAAFVEMQFSAGYEINIFDLQVGLQYPLPLEKVAITNFISLLVTPLTGLPYEGMDHLIEDVVDEVYRLCTDVPGGQPKLYIEGVEPLVDEAIARLGLTLPHHHETLSEEKDPTWWRDVVDALIDAGEHRLAGFAQRHAVPVLQDLLNAARTDEIYARYARIEVQTKETLIEVFERYIMNAIKNFGTLAAPTKLDLGDARVIVLDLARVAPSGSDSANRQTALMYMLGRHLIARNFFLHPEYAELPIVPDRVRDYHRERFTEMKETTKRVDYEEWHRAKDSPQVDKQAVRDVREGRKHNVQMGFFSQRAGDFSSDLIGQSTGRWILRCTDEREAAELTENFQLTNASAQIVRNRLPGPGAGGAPFFLSLQAGEAKYEQLLINVLGPIELWAFSSTPMDTAFRGRLFQHMDSARALRMLAIVFPGGSAEKEILRRKASRMENSGIESDAAEEGVLDALVTEMIEGRGIAVGVYERLNAMTDHTAIAA